MRRLICFFPLFVVAFSIQQGLAQTQCPDKHSISVQPVLWLDNLVPTELTGLSMQFETAISNSEALAARAVWFRDPLLGSALSGTNGYAFSLEYRHYFSTISTGWHIGPFVEWAGYQYLGYLRDYYGSSIKSIFDFGAIAGHKWETNKLVFDISARTSWYSPTSYPKGGYFPRMPSSNLNSQMILTVGYSLD